jgi:uncharacterized protein YcaQ
VAVSARRRHGQLSAQEARWLAVDAQGLGRPRPTKKGGATSSQIEATVDALGAVQVDAINVLERTQFLALFSRLGAYDRALLHQLTGPNGTLWEYWGHAASLMPVTDEPLLRWRYDIGGTYVPGPKVRARMEAWAAAGAEYHAAVLEEVRRRGPLAAGQLDDPQRQTGEWWDRRSRGRQALGWLASRGHLASWRTPSFEAVYDLPERVLPKEVLARPTPSVEDAHRELLLKSARASGVATVSDLAGYYMIQPRSAKPRVAELVDAGALVAVEVEGWDEPGYVVAGASPRRPTRRHGTLLSPFDSLIWDRVRTRRLFGFDYRIEVYVPEPKRVHGYYVLPLLVGGELVARFDLKADRKASVLRVSSAFGEAGIDEDAVVGAALSELDAMRAWLGLDGIAVAPTGGVPGVGGREGNLAAALAARGGR